MINNIERVASLFLTKTVYSMVLSILDRCRSPSTTRCGPIHLTLLSWFTIGIPAFFLALEPNDERVNAGFLQRVLGWAVPAGVVIAADDDGRVRDRPARHVDRRRPRPHGRRDDRRIDRPDEPVPRRPAAEPDAHRAGRHDGRPVRPVLHRPVHPRPVRAAGDDVVGLPRRRRGGRRRLPAAGARLAPSVTIAGRGGASSPDGRPAAELSGGLAGARAAGCDRCQPPGTQAAATCRTNAGSVAALTSYDPAHEHLRRHRGQQRHRPGHRHPPRPAGPRRLRHGAQRRQGGQAAGDGGRRRRRDQPRRARRRRRRVGARRLRRDPRRDRRRRRRAGQQRRRRRQRRRRGVPDVDCTSTS